MKRLSLPKILCHLTSVSIITGGLSVFLEITPVKALPTGNGTTHEAEKGELNVKEETSLLPIASSVEQKWLEDDYDFLLDLFSGNPVIRNSTETWDWQKQETTPTLFPLLENDFEWTENLQLDLQHENPLEETSPSSTPKSSPETIATDFSSETPVKIIAPIAEQLIDIPSTNVILQHPTGADITVTVNDRVVDDSLIGRIVKDQRTELTLKTWYGVNLDAGQNTIAVTGTLNGKPLPPASVAVEVRTEPTTIELETAAEIPADGRSTTTINGKLLDNNSNLSYYNSVVTLATSAGQFIGTDAKPDIPGFQVQSKEGRFSAELQAGVEAQTVRIQARTIELEAFTTVRFAPELRNKPLATGYIDFRIGGSGSNFYDSMREFVPLDEDNETQLEVTGAGFITGALGDWQYTGALNTSNPLNRDCCGEAPLLRAFENTNEVYPSYGDESQSNVITPSTDSFFFRLERASLVENADLDFAMWGDYNLTGFSEISQDFTAFSRTLHGFNGTYNWQDFQFSAFYANNVEGFQRDVIAPDGTRGFYFLSRRDLVDGSEQVYVEVEVLERPGNAIARERLNRGSDYDIDYDRGTILFDRPQRRTFLDDEGRILVRRLVVTYEFEGDQAEDSNLLGGRVKYYFSRDRNQPSWLGVTYIEENKVEQDFTLWGADALWSWGDNNSLVVEYARSNHDNTEFGDFSGSAYAMELNYQLWDGVNSQVYFESADSGFNNQSTGGFVAGQTRYGLQIDGEVSPTTSLRFQYEKQENEGIAPRPLLQFGDLLTPRVNPVPGSRVDNSLTTISAGVRQKIGKANLTVDWIHRDREDRIAPNALSSRSDQLRSSLKVPLNERLSLQALNTTTLSSDTDAVFSDQSSIDLNWKLYPGVELFASQTWYTRGVLAGESITNLGLQGEHDLGSNTRVRGSYGINSNGNRMSSIGSFGIEQGIILARGLKVDLGFEHVFTNDDEFRSANGVKFAQPYAFGQSSSSLGTIGGTSYNVSISYTNNPDFSAQVRWEKLTSSDRENSVFSANLTGDITPALTGIIDYQRADSANNLLDLDATTTLKLGLAYRDPTSDQFNALLRYEYRKDPDLIPESLLLDQGNGTQEHLFSIEAIYAPNWQWEFYGKFALRDSSTDLAEDYTASGHLTLTQLRGNYRFGEAFDLLGEVRWINQPSAGFSEVGFVTELGYMLTPNLRLAGGYVFGEVDDRDFRGVRSAQGPYLGVTVKLQGLMDLF